MVEESKADGPVAVKKTKVPPADPAIKKNTKSKTRVPEEDLLKKAWKKLNDWGLGISGKVILLLIVIGIISEVIKRI